MAVNLQAPIEFEQMVGLPVCRAYVGHERTIHFGFGKLVEHGDPLRKDPLESEWGIGAYYTVWRLLRGTEILCGVFDPVKSISELDARLNAIPLGAVQSLEHLSPFDFRVRLDNGVDIDFLCACNDDDELIHVFGPHDRYYEYSTQRGWEIGPSN